MIFRGEIDVNCGRSVSNLGRCCLAGRTFLNVCLHGDLRASALTGQLAACCLGVDRLAGWPLAGPNFQMIDIVCHFRIRSDPWLASQIWIVTKKLDFVR